MAATQHVMLERDMVAIKPTCFVLACLAALSAGSPVLADDGPPPVKTFRSTVVDVVDGDTVVVEHSGVQYTIGLYGADAPDPAQRHALEATRALVQLVYDETVTVQVRDSASSRTVADLRLADGTLVNEEMIEQGLAWWHEREAPSKSSLKRLHAHAQETGIGLWSDSDPVPPWEFRGEVDPVVNRIPELSGSRFDFSLPSLSGAIVNASDAKIAGKVLLVDIWGTWCPPCRQTVPYLEALYKELGPRGLELVGVAFERESNRSERRNQIAEFVRENGISYTVLDGGTTQQVYKSLPSLATFYGYPTVLVFDRQGDLIFGSTGIGGESWDQMRETIVSAL